MFYLLGETRETSAMPVSVQAELYRANDIENYDTTALRAKLASGTELLFYSTYAVSQRLGPRCAFEFENAVVEYDFSTQPRFVARFRDGRRSEYGDPNVDRTQKIWQSLDAVRTGAPVACGVQAATPLTVTAIAAQRPVCSIASFPETMRGAGVLGDDSMICIDGLDKALIECFERGVLPAEAGQLSWARPASVVKCGDTAPEPRPRATVTVSPRGQNVHAS